MNEGHGCGPAAGGCRPVRRGCDPGLHELHDPSVISGTVRNPGGGRGKGCCPKNSPEVARNLVIRARNAGGIRKLSRVAMFFMYPVDGFLPAPLVLTDPETSFRATRRVPPPPSSVKNLSRFPRQSLYTVWIASVISCPHSGSASGNSPEISSPVLLAMPGLSSWTQTKYTSPFRLPPQSKRLPPVE